MYVELETLLFFTLAAYAVRHLTKKDTLRSKMLPYAPETGEKLYAVTPDDRLLATQQLELQAGEPVEMGAPSIRHLAPHIHGRSQNQWTRTAWGEKGYAGQRNDVVRWRAVSQLAKGANPEYWRTVLANS